MLEEHTPHGIGNHAVIINEYNEPLANQLKEFWNRFIMLAFLISTLNMTREMIPIMYLKLI